MAHDVFISYGRADALDFAKRLASDLTKRGGYQVWIDLENIEKGGLFEVRIERGIRAADVVAAIMTRHSLREESVCRDEVVYALNERKPVVPIKLYTDPDVKPTLLLCRRNWLDFTQDYEEAFGALLEYLSGDNSVLMAPQLPTITGIVPLDFGPEIARLSAGFTGRDWLNAELGAWLEDPAGRALVIIGEPGIGKSAIAAWLSQVRGDQVVGVHFCTRRNTRTLDPLEFVASLVGQLSTQLDGYRAAVETRQPDVRRVTASDAFRELIVEPARSMQDPSQPVLVVVDSLDEAVTRADETVLDVLVAQALDLPVWLRIVTTTRPESRILRRLDSLSPYPLNADASSNLADLSEYVSQRLGAIPPELLPARSRDDVARKLEELAEGNFLYAKMTIDAMENGSLSVEELGRLSPGLAGYYAAAFRRLCPDAARYAHDYLPVLRALAVAFGPVPFRVLQLVSGGSPEELNRKLQDLSSFLDISGQGACMEYALFHRSLQEWLTSPRPAGDYWCSPEAGHAQMAEALEVGRAESRHSIRYLPRHLIAMGRWDEVAALFGDLEFLAAAWGADRFEVLSCLGSVEEHSRIRVNEIYWPIVCAPNRLLECKDITCLEWLLEEFRYLDEALSVQVFLVEHFRRTGNATELRRALHNLGNVHLETREHAVAYALFKEAELLSRKLGDLDGLHRALGNQGLVLLEAGRYDRAMELYREQEVVCRRLNNKVELSLALGNQAAILHLRGDMDQAMKLSKEKECICRGIGEQIELAKSLERQASIILRSSGDSDKVLPLLSEAGSIWKRTGKREQLRRSLYAQARVCRRLGNVASAAKLEAEAAGIPPAPAGTVDTLKRCDWTAYERDPSVAAYARGDFEQVMSILKERECRDRRTSSYRTLAHTLLLQAEVLAENLGRLPEALPLVEEAHRIVDEHHIEHHRQRSEYLLKLIRARLDGPGDRSP